MKYQKITKTVVLIAAISFALFACNSGNQNKNTEKQTYKTVGLVKSFDAGKGEITIDHEDIPGYMPAMEMTQRVADKKMLETLKTGDKIEFELERIGSNLVITKISKVTEVSGKIEANEIYKTNCAKCHGAKGEGARKRHFIFERTRAASFGGGIY